MLAADANAAELIRRITGSVPAPVGLNEAESRLYEVLFAACVEYYARFVRSLPVFEERAAAELLARTATLGAEVARLLERLPDRSLLAPDGTDQDTAFRRRYPSLNLNQCVLPDDPAALDLPACASSSTSAHNGPALPKENGA
ncbi:hypothetical protein ABZ830_22850 [Streptomyces coeruleorubidus]